MRPNIFDISTKELSQDAFITWLLQWADKTNKEFNTTLSNCGADFVTELIRKEMPVFNSEIEIVRAGRQWNNIDVWAKVNNKYLIIIEDKTFSGQHSGQLTKYKNTAEKWCSEQSPKYEPPICIYLKTGNESQQSLNKVVKEGFKIYNRQEFISLLGRHNVSNDIYFDFKTRLSRIEQQNNEWENKLIGNWKGNDWQGFFQYIEKKIGLVGWDFVNNPNGGFWNAALNWDYWNIYPVYLQTEQYKLCFKISTDPAEVEMPDNVSRGKIRNKISELILKCARSKNINTIRRPKRFGSGKYMTVAVVDSENWLGDKNEKINKEKVSKQLLYYKNFLLDTIKNSC
ncbi:PD-(D/E)XK nuclease family protein [candidate division KSB1 bacterium]|nr:PD-(D/E)XK nuclease family protein [candidate division KSB1 bacterium]